MHPLSAESNTENTMRDDEILIAEVEEMIAEAWLRREDQRHAEHVEALGVDPDNPAALAIGDLADTPENLRRAARLRGFNEATIERVVRFYSHAVD
jgi:hypothetical protein